MTMRVLLIIPTLGSGGAERVISVIANEWAAQGIQVDLVLLAKGHKSYQLSDNICLFDFSESFKTKIEKIKSLFHIARKIRELLKKNNYEFVLSFLTHVNLFVLLSSVFVKSRFVVSDRNYVPLSCKWYERVARYFIYRKASMIICQTSSDYNCIDNQILSNAVEKVVIPNPIREIHHLEPKKKTNTVISVGRLTEQKGHMDLIESFNRIKLEGWTLEIYGDGPLREKLNELIISKGLENKVFLKGRTNNIDLPLSRAKIFVLSSYYEGFPNALIEAMAHGCACVSYDCMAGPRDIIEDTVTGELCELGNVDMLTDKLEKLMLDERLIEKYNSSDYILNHLDSKLISKKYLQVCSREYP